MDLANFLPQRGRAPRIQIFVSDFGASSVVRNAVAISNQAAVHGYDVRLLTRTSNGVLRDQIDPKVKVVELRNEKECSSRRSQLRRVLRAYRRHSSEWRPDVLFSAGNHGHLLGTLAWFGLRGTKVLRISNDVCHGRGSGFATVGRQLKFRLMAIYMRLFRQCRGSIRQERPVTAIRSRMPDFLSATPTNRLVG